LLGGAGNDSSLASQRGRFLAEKEALETGNWNAMAPALWAEKPDLKPENLQLIQAIYYFIPQRASHGPQTGQWHAGGRGGAPNAADMTGLR